MGGNNYIAQAFILVLYVITLTIYGRATREYAGGKIGAAINMILVFVALLFLSDYVDYFLTRLMPVGEQEKLNIQIFLRMVAIGVLCYGGLRFFATKGMKGDFIRPASWTGMGDTLQPSWASVPDDDSDETAVAQDIPETEPALGRYEILEELGRGAMGIVYKGRDPKLGRLTAIKTVRFSNDFDADQVEKMKDLFFREAEVVAKLSHPNIVTIYDVGEDLDLSYLAMEFLEGEDLEQYTKKVDFLSVKQCIDIVIQVCDALNYAHDKGVVHRDIKPGNIMVLKNGQVKVTDFGIARVTASSKTRTGEIKGTPLFMSPEQFSSSKVDGRSDIFSLGIVFYWLLTKQLPFRANSLTSLMYQITKVKHEPPTKYNPRIHKAMETILDRALEKNIEKRYQTAKQMGDHLRLVGQKIDEARAKAKR